jgi:hypothetical protein
MVTWEQANGTCSSTWDNFEQQDTQEFLQALLFKILQQEQNMIKVMPSVSGAPVQGLSAGPSAGPSAA